MSVIEIDSAEFVKYLESEYYVYVKAFREENNTLKMYLFSQDNIAEAFYLTFLNLDFTSQTLNYTIKSHDRSLLEKYEEYFLNVIAPIL